MRTGLSKDSAFKKVSLPEPVFVEENREDTGIEIVEPTIKDLKEVSVSLAEQEKIDAEIKKAIEDAYKSGNVDFYKKALGHKLLKKDEERKLIEEYQKGSEEAWEKLILHNLKLVWSFAKKYEWSTISSSINFWDLVQWGNIGLMKGIKKFDPKRGTRLSTYASWWIKQQIRIGIRDTKSTIRIPVHVQEDQLKVRRARRILADKLGRAATPEEIAKKLNIPIGKVIGLQQIKPEISLHQKFESHSHNSDSDGAELLGSLADKTVIDPETMNLARMKFEELLGQIKKIFSVFRELPSYESRNVQIFKEYYFLDGNFEIDITLELVASHFGITRERIRQIDLKMWRIIKDYPEIKVNKDNLHILVRDLKVLSEFFSTPIDFSKLLGDNDEQKSPMVERKRYGKKKLLHILASLAYFRWKPEKGIGPEISLIDFISKVYEVKAEDIGNPAGDQMVKWARCVIAHIMTEDLHLSFETVASYICFKNKKKVFKYLEILKTQLAIDGPVKEDVENLRAHFKKVMAVRK